MMKFAVIAAAAAFVGTSAAGQPVTVTKVADQLPTVLVSYADLNLGSPSGQDRLKRRISSAASQVCQFGYADMALDEFIVTQACYKSARADGLRQMDQVLAARSAGTTLAAASLTISAK